MSEIIQIEVSSEKLADLEEVARIQRRTVDDVVRDMIMHGLPTLPPLPADLESELAAFEHLSDDVLWLLATSTLSAEEQEELAMLNEAAQQREVTLGERERQDMLLDAYDRVLVRRAHAAAILMRREHDINRIINDPHK